MSSLFSKLSKPTTVSGSGVRSGSWRVSLVRHDDGALPNFFLSGSSGPLKNLSRGCVVQAQVDGVSFLISFNLENTRCGDGASVISGSTKVLESLGVGREVKELEILDDVSPDLLERNTLDHLLVSIKGRYISKRELWIFQIRLLGAVLFKNASPPFGQQFLQCDSTVLDMNRNKRCVYGIVGPQTRIIVRSESAQIVLFLLVSAECWEFNPTTREPNFATMIHFLTKSFSDAIDRGHTHHVTFLFVTRSEGNDTYEKRFEGPIERMNVDDFREGLLEFFHSFPQQPAADQSHVNFVKDSALCGCTSGVPPVGEGKPASAIDAPILESINLGISHFTKHHLDRKLHVTGTQITLLTCNTGTGIRCTDRNLFEVSRRRVEDSACGIKILSVGQKPTIVRPTRVLLSYSRANLLDDPFEQGTHQVEESIEATWLPMNFISGSFPIGPLIDDFEICEIARKIKPKLASAAPGNLDTRVTPIPKPYFRERRLREKRTDSEIADLAIVSPRLQRVATEANIKPSDIKQIDNWIVQGEGIKTLHDLIGMRLSMDMQMIDISGTPMDDTSMGATLPSSPTLIRSQISDTLSSEYGDVSGIISANVFGVKVHRASMRENHITKVLIKGEDKCMWNLHHLDSGNVYVSKVELIADSGPKPRYEDFMYTYVLKESSSELHHSIGDIIECKNCQLIGPKISHESVLFSVHSPLPWNVIDDLIANVYIQQTLPSTVPLFNEHVSELKLRSSVKTGVFVILNSAHDGIFWKHKLESLLGVKQCIVRNENDWFWFHCRGSFIFSIEWILCHSAKIENAIKKIQHAVSSESALLVRLPHAQLFDSLPFQNSVNIDCPHGNQNFLNMLVSRLVSLLGMTVIVKDQILASKTGSCFVAIQGLGKISWIPNYTKTWIFGDDEDLFLKFRQIVHTSVIDSTRY